MGKASEKRGIAKVAAKVALIGPTERPGSGRGSMLRAEELLWLVEHPDVLAQYQGQWVILEGSKVVCHGVDFVEVVSRARDVGISTPFAIRIPAKQEGPIVV